MPKCPKERKQNAPGTNRENIRLQTPMLKLSAAKVLLAPMLARHKLLCRD